MTALTTGSPGRELRRWDVAGWFLIGLYLLGLAAFGLAVAAPALAVRVGLRAYTEPTAFWPVLVQVVLGVAAFVCYYVPRRRQTRSFSFLVTGVLAATTIVLGLASYLSCTESSTESAFWAPLTWSLNLVTGNVSSCTLPGTPPGVTNPPPLALQVARLFGPLLLVIATLGIVASLFRARHDLFRVRFAGSLVLLVGLTDQAMPLLRRLSLDRERRTTLAVLVTDGGNPLIKAARDLGARVVVCELDVESLQSLLTAQGRFKVRAFYAVSEDVALNQRWAAVLRAVADTSRPSRADLAPHMVVRIDDPWQAEYWRRTNAYRTRGTGDSVRWISDALSVYEVTAALLLDRILDQPEDRAYDRLVIVGNSPLALAVCTELTQREREGEVLERTPSPSFADVVLFGPEAERLREQHRLRQERFGNHADVGQIPVVIAAPTTENLRLALERNQRPALVLADDPTLSEPQLATYLAALNPSWTIFDWSPSTRGVAAEPVMEQLHPFGLTTEAPLSVPVDSWERAARVVHERFLLDGERHGWLDPAKPSHRSWDDGLPPFFKESNIRQVTTALAAAESLGRSWGPVQQRDGQGLESTANLSAADVEEMARMEHASWMRFHLERRWRYGSPRDDARKVHPSLLDWAELTEDDQSKTRDGVRNALRILDALGYRSTVLRDPNDSVGWVRAERHGEVEAECVPHPWTWTNDAGEAMVGRAGDWRVTSDEGQTWSVAPDVFAKTYAPVSASRYRRTGEVLARRAQPGEVVASLEGNETARDGDWVLRGTAGEEWVTSASHFAASYTVRG